MLVVLGMRPGLWTAHLAVTLVAAHIPMMQVPLVYKTVSSTYIVSSVFCNSVQTHIKKNIVLRDTITILIEQ